MPKQSPVLFPSYTPDGPSYVGPVEISIDGRCLEVKTGPDAIARAELTAAMPAILACSRPTPDQLKSVFAALPDVDREYLGGDHENLSAERVMWLTFEDGVEGAVMLGGEACIVTVVRFEPTGPRSEAVEARGGDRYTVAVTLTVQAQSEDHAHGLAEGAAKHLLETFNDDGSLISASVPDGSAQPDGEGRYTVDVMITVLAEDEDYAHGMGEGAADHLLDTFNDDGSVLAATVLDEAAQPADTSGDRPAG